VWHTCTFCTHLYVHFPSSSCQLWNCTLFYVDKEILL
jgi:hypothetical protein